jgi:hypothetical protein
LMSMLLLPRSADKNQTTKESAPCSAVEVAGHLISHSVARSFL